MTQMTNSSLLRSSEPFIMEIPQRKLELFAHENDITVLF